jgi:hypothetical protein
MLIRAAKIALGLVLAMLLVSVCAPEGEEPRQVSLPVVSDGSGVAPCTNAEGWTVELDELRVAIRDLEFTIEGEAHARRTHPLLRILSPRALAHPGHLAGGDVTGELSGAFVLDMFAQKPEPLGEAVLLEGDYNGVNFTFRAADASDDLAADDPLIGHTAYMAGVAARDEESVAFTATLDQLAADTQMVGGVFDLTVTESTTATLALGIFTIDPSENDTLFDGIDFGALDDDEDGTVDIVPGDEAHNILVKTLERHDHYGVSVQ